MHKILIIDDDLSICESLKMILSYERYYVDYALNAFDGLEKLREEKFNLVILDIKMPGKDGLEAISEIKAIDESISVIMLSAHGTISNAVEATQKGAFDFLEKPPDKDKIIIAVRNALNTSNLVLKNRLLTEKISEDTLIIGESEQIKNIKSLIARVAPTNSRILITGENGTGKELVAKEIHRLSNRADKPFVETNCAAIPNELIESELFGHEKGSFTGAISQRIGKFEQANFGTLFLDEIGDMSLNAQAKVLRSIENGTIERVGGSRNISVDVRIIAATNKNLPKEIEAGNFREDLYHRINVIPIYIPPLRERKEDIPLLIEHFTKKICAENSIKSKSFSKEAINYLMNQHWKGNIRELKNLIERIIIMSTSNVFSVDDIKGLFFNEKKEIESLDFSMDSFEDFKDASEKAFIIKKLNQYGWNISKTAESLGIQRSHLYNKINKYGIERKKDE